MGADLTEFIKAVNALEIPDLEPLTSRCNLQGALEDISNEMVTGNTRPQAAKVCILWNIYTNKQT